VRYERPHPWQFAGAGANLEGGCDCPRNAFGFKTGCACNANVRKRYSKSRHWVTKSIDDVPVDKDW
jgi:hypothetical protein